MRKFMMYLCYVLAFLVLIGSVSVGTKSPNFERTFPYSIAWFAAFFRLAQIFGAPKDGIVFWKRLVIGIAKTLLCVVLAVCLAATIFNFDQTASGWLFGIFFVFSVFYFKSERVLGWFTKKSQKVEETKNVEPIEQVDDKSVEIKSEDVEL